MVHPKYTYVRFKIQGIGFYIETRQTLSMIPNWDEFLTGDAVSNSLSIVKDVQFDGPATLSDNGLLALNFKQFIDKKFHENIKTMSPGHCKMRQLALRRRGENRLANTKLQTRLEIFDFMVVWQNRKTRESALGLLTPILVNNIPTLLRNVSTILIVNPSSNLNPYV